MPHPLQSRVQTVRRKAVALVRLHGLCLWASAAIVTLACFALLDYLLRLQDPAVRWVFSAGALAIVLLAAWRLVRPLLAYRPNLVQVAQRIERFYPQLGQQLSSAVDFLSQHETDKTAGSTELRRAVVAQAEAISADLDFRQAIDGRLTRHAALLLLGILAVLVVIFSADLPGARLAAGRLLTPWRGDLAWPRRHELAFVRHVEKIAAGDDLELEIIDQRGRLPDVVRVQVRYPTPTGSRTENRQLRPLADRAVFRLDNVTQPLAYRASGGDDDSMPWTELAVIQPPKVLALAIAVRPPAYTGLPIENTGRVARAIVGSGLAISGRVDKPLTSARLKSETPGAALPPVAIGAGGLAFTVPADPEQPWLVEKSGVYWVELADESGLPTGRDTRFELQAVADSPPSISWETPADHTFVTPQALVPIKCLTKDDLGIRRIELRYLRPGHSGAGEQVVVFYEGPVHPQPAGALGEGDSRTIDQPWDLAQLAGLMPGDVLAIRITAEDYRPQLTTSVVRRLSIITDQELESRIGQRQSAVLGQLAEALRIQRECRSQLAALQIRLEENGRLDESDLNHLQRAQLNQRQVEKLLGGGPEGVEGQLAALLDELTANRIEGQGVSMRMNDLLAKVRELNRQPLVEINQRLTEGLKEARGRLDACNESTCGQEAAAGDWLQTAAARQDEVIGTLEGLLGTLTEWDSFSRLAREIGQVRSDQQHLADETDALRLAAIAASTPPGDQRTRGRQLQQQQLELARRLDKIQGRMEQMLGRLRDSDPLASGTLADALDAARRLAIGGQMRDAAGKLGQQQLGASHASQGIALEGLKRLLDVLSSRREDELARTVKSLRAAAGELRGLQTRQQAAGAELAAAAAEQNAGQKRRRLERLTRELAQLAQEADQLGRKLQRLTAPRAAEAMAGASASDAAAGQSAAAGDGEQAQEQAGQAERRLEDAQREIEQAIAQAEQELAQQLLARMEQWIEGLLARQKGVLAETIRLAEARGSSDGQLTAAQQATLRGTAAEERLIAEETENLRQKMAEQAAFAFALEGARQEMLRAAAMLQRGLTNEQVQEAIAAGATRLEQMLAALKPDVGQPPPSPPPDSPPPPAPPGGQQDPFTSLAALKLLQLLQGEINRRTQELETTRQRQGSLDDEQLRLLESLSAEQGRLAEMVLDMIRQSIERPEDNPDLLPEIDKP